MSNFYSSSIDLAQCSAGASWSIKTFLSSQNLVGTSDVRRPSYSRARFYDLFLVEWLKQYTSFSVPKSFLYLELTSVPMQTPVWTCLRRMGSLDLTISPCISNRTSGSTWSMIQALLWSTRAAEAQTNCFWLTGEQTAGVQVKLESDNLFLNKYSLAFRRTF